MKPPTSVRCAHTHMHRGNRLLSKMTNGHFATAIKNMQAKSREREVKWKEGENGCQGASNETEDRKEAVKVKARETQGVNAELRALTDIPAHTAIKGIVWTI